MSTKLGPKAHPRLLLPMPSLISCLGVWLLLVAGCGSALPRHASAGEAGRTFTVDDLLALKRIGDIEVSPDGTRIVFSVSVPDMEKNEVTTHLWLASPSGGPPRQLTNGPSSETSPRWAPDSRRIAFVASRDGKPQIWTIAADGGEATQVTRISTGASSPQWSPDGGSIAFLSEVWPGLEGGDEAQKKRAEEIEKSGIRARTIDHLLYRHWSSWTDGKRPHLLVVPAGGGEARDITPWDSDVLGSFAFSPDGREVAVTRGPISRETGTSADVEAWSTNADVWVVPVRGGDAVCLTAGNPGWDGDPRWSPDGRFIAFRSQARDGYEADRFRLAVLDRKTGEVNYHLPVGIDRSVGEILWAPDSRTVYLGMEDAAHHAIFAVDLAGLAQEGRPRTILDPGMAKASAGSRTYFSRLSMPSSGAFLVGGLQSLTHPTEVAILGGLSPSAEPRKLEMVTRINDDLLRTKDMPRVEEVRYPGALGREIQAWVLTPPGPAPQESRPFVLFIHGGPQGSWDNTFHYRWNLALFASRGYVVMAPNFHGSTGFGQEFTEQISGDWGGASYEDLMKGVDWAIARGLADPQRLAAMGGSFGGYMVNWILGHTDRFQALISHAGVYNLESMYGTTEELWFPEWDLRGTPWRNDGGYARFSPHRFAGNFKTPTLVIHGELDYRVPVSEAMQLFTALRRQGVEARFLCYPDEGHWIQKPRNAKLWVESCFEWIEKHTLVLRPRVVR